MTSLANLWERHNQSWMMNRDVPDLPVVPEDGRREQGEDRHELDEDVQGRAARVLEGVADLQHENTKDKAGAVRLMGGRSSG